MTDTDHRRDFHCATHGWWNPARESGCPNCVIQLRRELADARTVSDRWAAEALKSRALLERAIGHVKAQLYAEQTEPPYKARPETIELHDAICDALAAQPA